MCNTGIARVSLFIFNFIFWLGGGAVLGIGIWMKADDAIVQYLKVVNIDHSDPLVDHAAILFIVVGAFVFLIGFLGCLGALRGNQAVLFLVQNLPTDSYSITGWFNKNKKGLWAPGCSSNHVPQYALLVLIVMIIEVAGAVLAIVYRKKVEDHLQESMVRQIREDYEDDNVIGQAWDFLQVKLKCCGAFNSSDYQNSAWWNTTRVNNTHMYVPKSCCVLKNDDPRTPEPKDLDLCQKDVRDNKQTNYFHHQGCHQRLHEWFQRNTLILAIVGFVIGAIQIFGFVAACCLRSALKRDKPYNN